MQRFGRINSAQKMADLFEKSEEIQKKNLNFRTNSLHFKTLAQVKSRRISNKIPPMTRTQLATEFVSLSGSNFEFGGYHG